jgi:hypothetical protein
MRREFVLVLHGEHFVFAKREDFSRSSRWIVRVTEAHNWLFPRITPMQAEDLVDTVYSNGISQ